MRHATRLTLKEKEKAMSSEPGKMALGIAVGVGVGAALGDVPVGITIGIALGAAASGFVRG